MMPELYLAPALGAVGKPMFRVHTAGSVGGSTALVAAHLISSGIHKRVLTVAYEKQSDSDAMWALSVPQPFAAPLLAGAGGYFAPHIRAYMRRSGAPDYIGRMVAVKDRQNALRNPYAHLHLADIDMKMVEDSMMLWDPLRYLEACPSSDGAAAMVLSAEDAVSGQFPAGVGPRDGHADPSRPCSPAATRSIRRPGATARPTSTGRPGSPTPAARSMWPRSTCRSAGTSRCGWRTSGSANWATGGSSPRRAPPPSTGTSRGTRPGGVLSSNPIGASGMLRFLEVAMQVRGQAGEHQVDGARRRPRPGLRRGLPVLRHVGGRERQALDRPRGRVAPPVPAGSAGGNGRRYLAPCAENRLPPARPSSHGPGGSRCPRPDFPVLVRPFPRRRRPRWWRAT